MKDLRALLAKSGEGAQEGATLFSALYRSWCHSAGAVLALCFLAEAYAHASDLVMAFATIPVGVEVLVQVRHLTSIVVFGVFCVLETWKSGCCEVGKFLACACLWYAM